MADESVILNPGSGGAAIAVDTISGISHELVKVEFGSDGTATQVDAANPLPVTDAIAESALASLAAEDFATEATLAALSAKITNPLPINGTVGVSGSVTVVGALTDTQLRATPVPISGTISTGLTQPLTDAQLRATPVPVSGTISTGLTQPLTDTQLRATPVPISGTITAVTAITNALPAGNNNIGDVDVVTLPALVAGTAIIGKTGIDQTTDGTTNKVRATATRKPSIGATVVMTVTNLQSLASSATAGWQSVRVSNMATLANDYEIFVKLTTANTAPGSDKAAYIFVCPFYTTDAGSTWFASSQGTATLPTGSEGTTTIASPHNLRLLGVLNYTTQLMVLQDTFLLSNCFGDRLPDGFSIIIINFTGAALSTGCVVDYSSINDTLT